MTVLRRWGLLGRSIALCTVLLVGAVTLLSAALITQDYHSSFQTMVARAVTDAHSLAHSAEPGVLLNDRDWLIRTVHATAVDEAVERVVLRDATGDELVRYQRDPAKVFAHPTLPGGTQHTPTHHGEVDTRWAGDHLTVECPIWRESAELDLGPLHSGELDHAQNDVLGVVQITYSLTPLRTELSKRVFVTLGVAAFVLAAGLIATMLAVGTLLRPLHNFVQTTAAIARGRRGQRASEQAIGELGELARSFNYMADCLEASYASIEQKVAERTRELEERRQELENEVRERRRAESSLLASKERLRRQNAALVGLSRSTHIETGHLRTALREIAEAAAQTLDVARVGVWTFSDDGMFLRCVELYEQQHGGHELVGTELRTDGFPAYMRALGSDRTIAADNVLTDPRTREFADSYLGPLGITSMLDAPVRVGSATVGVICHEHVGPPRQWTLEEQQFAGSMADLVAVAMQVHKRGDAENRLREHTELLVTKNQQLRKQREQLRQREHELLETNRALEAAKAAAEAASRAKSDFVANMSHEIRTPLTAVLGFAEALLDPALPVDERRTAIRAIRSNSDHLLQIVNDILDISRIEAGKLVIEQSTCEVLRVVADVESLMRPRAVAKGLDLDIEYAGRVPSQIRTDTTRLRQILINLVGNAIKFTERGSVRLRISLVPDASPRLRFEVIDTGIGMTEEQCARLFRPFSQADATTTRRYGGTGLGLAISRRLAEMLGGSVAVSSKVNEGSTFALEIATGPLDDASLVEVADGAVSTQVETPAEALPPGTLPGHRLLLVEDGPDNQRLIAYLLTKAGAEVETVENGKLAVECALAAFSAGKPFDVVLMDMQMPVMDGYEATRILRAKGYDRPIIALTAHAMQGDRERCLAAGCDDYAVKPIDRHNLIDTIQKHAGGRSPRAGGGPQRAIPVGTETQNG